MRVIVESARGESFGVVRAIIEAAAGYLQTSSDLDGLLLHHKSIAPGINLLSNQLISFGGRPNIETSTGQPRATQGPPW